MHQLHRTKREHFSFTQHFRWNETNSVPLAACSYFSYRRLRDDVLKWIFRSDCCEVFVQNCNFLLIIPSRWTGRKKKKPRHFCFNCNASRRASAASTNTSVSAPLTWTLRPSLPLRLTWWTESRTSCVRCICKADPGSSPLSLRYRWGRRRLWVEVKATAGQMVADSLVTDNRWLLVASKWIWPRNNSKDTL